MRFRKKGWVLNSSIWRAVLSLFYPPVIIQGKNGKNSESPVGSNKSEKRKPKSAVYRSILASVVYFHIRLISTRRHKREMTRNQFERNLTRVRIPPAAPHAEPLGGFAAERLSVHIRVKSFLTNYCRNRQTSTKGFVDFSFAFTFSRQYAMLNTGSKQLFDGESSTIMRDYGIEGANNGCM